MILAILLCACTSPPKVSPSKSGAQHECANTAVHLSGYNDCMQDVDQFFEGYEEHRRQQESDGD